MKLFGYSIRVEVIILSLILLFIINLNTICGCTTVTAAEGFTIAQDAYDAVKDGLTSVAQKHSLLPEGFDVRNNNLNEENKNLHFFEQSDFSTECCPSKYSSSYACACENLDKNEEIKTRGGNSSDMNLL